MKPKGLRRERILLMGGYGSGKSYAWLKIADWVQPEGAKVYVIDTDMAYEAYADGKDLSNVECIDGTSYDEVKEGLGYFTKKATNQDWLVVDMVGKLWTFAQEYYSEQVVGKDLSEWFLEAKKGNESIAGEYGSNWGVINRLYDALMSKIKRWPGHVLCCTSVGQVQEPNKAGKGGDSLEVRSLYGKFGVKPDGQKHLGHDFHSVILMMDTGKGWKMSTVRDREREIMKGVDVEDFALAYLIGVGGWTL